LPNVFQNGFSSIRKAAPPKEPETEPFFKEPEPCQTDPKSQGAIDDVVFISFVQSSFRERWGSSFDAENDHILDLSPIGRKKKFNKVKTQKTGNLPKKPKTPSKIIIK
jgi:hypothetical protein